MTDRELLEAAAKAAGYGVEIVSSREQHGTVGFYMKPDLLWWDPLTDDGDALRLAVKLGLEVSHNSFGNVIVDHYTRPESQKVVLAHGANPCAATRRAIVRAAAAMVETTSA